jgi:archaellin
MITKLGKNGIDITQVQADLSADNTAAVLSWFRTYHKDHPQTLANRTWTKPPVNATQQAEHLQSMITNLGKTGADITQVQTDLSAGNTAAVLTWFQAYHKDHPVAALNAYGNKTGTRTTGDFFPKFAGHAMNSGNRSAMNGIPMARHPGCSVQAP